MERRCEQLGQEGVQGRVVENLRYDLKSREIDQHVQHMRRTSPVVEKGKYNEKQGK